MRQISVIVERKEGATVSAIEYVVYLQADFSIRNRIILIEINFPIIFYSTIKTDFCSIIINHIRHDKIQIFPTVNCIASRVFIIFVDHICLIVAILTK
jgi:hypothetical protein